MIEADVVSTDDGAEVVPTAEDEVRITTELLLTSGAEEDGMTTLLELLKNPVELVLRTGVVSGTLAIGVVSGMLAVLEVDSKTEVVVVSGAELVELAAELDDSMTTDDEVNGTEVVVARVVAGVVATDVLLVE